MKSYPSIPTFPSISHFDMTTIWCLKDMPFTANDSFVVPLTFNGVISAVRISFPNSSITGGFLVAQQISDICGVLQG